MRRNRTVIEILTIIALIVVLGLIGAITVDAAGGALSRIRALRVTNQAVFDSAVSVDGATTLNDTLSVGGATDLADTLDVTGALTAGNALSVTTFLKLAPATAIVCANGATITPTGTYQLLTSAGTVEVTLTVTSQETGEILVLENTANQAITIKDVNINGTGDLALAQWDTAMYVFNGAKWTQLGTSNN